MRAIVPCLLVLAACELPAPKALITCHNANCAHSDPRRDDTLEALDESLALETRGLSLLDGVEVDLIWDPIGQRCLFGHGPDSVATAPDAHVAFERVADHLRTKGPLAAWNTTEFSVRFELKSGANGDEHTPLSPAARYALADCALDGTELVEAAGVAGGIGVVVMFHALEIEMFHALEERPRWRPEISGPHAPRQLTIAPTTDPFELRPQIGVVTVSYLEVRDGDYTTYQDLADQGVDLMMWQFDMTEDVLGAIEYLAPRYINTNEAPLVRRWVDPD